jgi:hypothetical protein
MADDIGNTPTTAGTIALGGEVSSDTVDRDQDWFSITLEAGAIYNFQLLGAFDQILSVVDSSGKYLHSEYVSGGSVTIKYRALVSGTHFLATQGGREATNPYTLKAALAPLQDDFAADTTTTGRLAVGARVAGNFEVADDVDWYAVTLESGITYQFEMSGLTTAGSALPSPNVRLLNAQGVNIEGGINPSAGVYFITPDKSDVYYVRAGQLGTRAEGSYTLAASVSLIQDDFRGDTATTGRVTVGSNSIGNFELAGDADAFRVELSAGVKYTFELLGAKLGGGTATAGLRLSVSDSAGLQLPAAYRGYVSGDAVYTYTASASGTYYLTASGTSQGTYTVKASVSTIPSYTVTGTAANEIFHTTSGDDTIKGEDGLDIVRFIGPRSAYEVVRPIAGLNTTVRGLLGQGIDELRGIERLEFTDKGIAVDFAGSAGHVARAIGAIFGGQTFNMPEYVAESLALLDQGMSYEAFMQRNLDTILGAKASSEAIVGLLYRNVRGMDPPTAAMNYYASLLNDGAMTPGQLGVFAANHDLNLIKVIGLEKSGLSYSV